MGETTEKPSTLPQAGALRHKAEVQGEGSVDNGQSTS